MSRINATKHGHNRTQIAAQTYFPFDSLWAESSVPPRRTLQRLRQPLGFSPCDGENLLTSKVPPESRRSQLSRPIFTNGHGRVTSDRPCRASHHQMRSDCNTLAYHLLQRIYATRSAVVCNRQWLQRACDWPAKTPDSRVQHFRAITSARYRTQRMTHTTHQGQAPLTKPTGPSVQQPSPD